jgi:hypothetical protein
VHGRQNGMTHTGHSPCRDHDLLFVHGHIPLGHDHHRVEIASRQIPDTAGAEAQVIAATAVEVAVRTEIGAAIDIKPRFAAKSCFGYLFISHSNRD